MKRTIFLAMMVSLFAVGAYAQNTRKRQGYIADYDSQELLSFNGDVAEVSISRIGCKAPNDVNADSNYSFTTTYKFNKRGDIIEAGPHAMYEWTYKHIYNANGRMIKTIKYWHNELLGYTLHIYNANGKLIEDRGYGVNEKTPSSITRYTYDANGNLTSKIGTERGGKIYHHQSYRYDSKNRLIEHTCVMDEEEPEAQYREYFVYDAKGNIIERRECDLKGKLIRRVVSKYDSKNREIEKLFYSRDDDERLCCEKTTYKYDAYNNIVEEVEYNDKGALSHKITRKFNSYKKLIEETKHDGSGAIIFKYCYKYDANQNIIEKTGYNVSLSISYKYCYKYDANQNEIEKTEYDGSGAISSKYCYKYDANQNKIESTKYDKNGEFEHKRVIKYDSKNRKIEELVHDKANVLLEKSCWVYDHMDNEIEYSCYDYRKEPENNYAISKFIMKIVYR